MPKFSAEKLEKLTCEIFEAAGVPTDEAQIVAESLVKSNLTGHDSHGVIRVTQYTSLIEKGGIVPGAKMVVVKENATTAVLDGNWGFGQVMGRKAMEIAMKKAKDHSIAAVSMLNSNHIGRLGEYPAVAVEQNMIGIIMVNNHGGAQYMPPWGGTARRLSSNPISIAMPTGGDDPILLDISTTVSAEGKVRVRRNRGEELPEGYIIDAQGNPTTDPNDLYGPPVGAILPFGGIVGHKGYGLGFIIDALAGALSGAGCSRADAERVGNAVFIMVIDIEAFISPKEFKNHMDGLIKYVKSSPKMPGVSEILFPGEIEAKETTERLEDGIFIEDETWNQIFEAASSLGVDTSRDEFKPI